MREPVLIISEKLARDFLSEEEAIAQVENTWRWYGEGSVIMPSKITLDLASLGVNGWFNSMPSYISETGYAGIKFVGGFSDNPGRGMPFIRAKILLCDPETGMLKALVAGDWISEIRTGAQPAIACKYLASSTDVITIIGAGQMAKACLRCMARILKIREVRICDISAKARASFAEAFADAPFAVVPSEDTEKACTGSDVIITVTTADAPLVKEKWVKKGALVLTMGSYTETDADLVTHSDLLIADHIGQSVHRGNFKAYVDAGLISEESFAATLPEIIAGKKQGRHTEDERILCELVGMGAPDAACAALLIEKLREAGMDVPIVDLGL